MDPAGKFTLFLFLATCSTAILSLGVASREFNTDCLLAEFLPLPSRFARVF
jgi:hypothetical protein